MVSQSFQHFLLHRVAWTDFTIAISGGFHRFSLKGWDCDLDHLGILEILGTSHQGFTKVPNAVDTTASPPPFPRAVCQRRSLGPAAARPGRLGSRYSPGGSSSGDARMKGATERNTQILKHNWTILNPPKWNVMKCMYALHLHESPNWFDWFDWFGLFGPNWMPCSMFRTVRPQQCVMYIISQSSC